ncbi:spermidine synthase [Sulfurimonas sp. HSL3-7]|uniref:spermine/spermidine synthase domain-containing protein n=1 Tax=Sulfonitrofixus jiaomeiensis TaxID=3131938 RepID=UPI0031F7F79E
MKEFIYPEMMVHVPLCTVKEPKNVLIVSDNAAALEAEVARHDAIASKTVSASNLLESLRNEADASADVVLVDTLTDDAAVMAHINRVLNEEGLVVLKHPSLDDEAANKFLMQIMGNYFKIIMPYNVGNGETLLLGSKAYHPTADIILHRADMLDGQQYYNCDIHPAAFATPNYIRKAYLGIIRN